MPNVTHAATHAAMPNVGTSSVPYDPLFDTYRWYFAKEIGLPYSCLTPINGVHHKAQ